MTPNSPHDVVVSTHFGSRTRPPKPVLLMIVFGLLVVIVGVTAVAQTILISFNVANVSLNATISSDAATVRTFVNGLVEPDDLTGASSAAHVALVEAGLRSVAERGQILRIEIRDPAGVVRLSNEPGVRGEASPDSASFANALAGNVDPKIVDAGSGTEAVGPSIEATKLIREYFPLVGSDGVVHGVVAIWRDAGPILLAIDEARWLVVVLTISAAVIVSLFLFFVFRAAQRRITRQTIQLVEASRLDALTGLPNHGTLVGELALALETAERDGVPIGVVLTDLDNFKLVNDTYGHASGDIALTQLARTLVASMPEGAMVGRYGPDEFLVIVRAATVEALEAIVETVREQLGATSLDVEAAERLPITISTGIATFPEHGRSVTELLSVVAVVLAEAKASGGDAIRVAGRGDAASADTRSFDVLQGLVFAVDTKDRYTKRHSEDVARYGSFLATQAGLDEGLIAGIGRAGLLHDVGKIGIPDAILRKPGRLTDDEYDIVKQHVALGDSIVRNLPDTELIRAGIRHHHERWDGKGYLHALAGDDIPMIARVLAVADAFSAMTTTRPYRKALSVEEALRRLGDAAGTQLDERLVAAFIHGIETVPNAPLPGADRTGPALWVPSANVA